MKFTVERRILFGHYIEPVVIEADNEVVALQSGLNALRREYPHRDYRMVQLVELPFYIEEVSSSKTCRWFPDPVADNGGY